MKKLSISKAFWVAGVSVLTVSALFASPAWTQNEVDGPKVEFPKQVPVPADNPQTPDKIALGKQLYFDGRLSKTGKISCNSCHDATKFGVDGKPRSPGHDGRLGGRNSPGVFNSAFSSVQFWDGRAPSLEAQAKGPMTNPIEMGMESHDAVVKVLSGIPGYVSQFEKVFGKGPITIDNVVKAIASYERTLVTPGSAYDRFVAGDAKALNDSAKRGWRLVQTVGCTSCHSGAMFSGPALPMGTGFYQKFPVIPGTEYDKKYKFSDDLGRFEVTKAEGDKHFFRVPSWRNVADTGPYFHNGAVKTLDEAVRVMGKTQLNKDLAKNEVEDIVAFLKSLSGKYPNEKAPKLP